MQRAAAAARKATAKQARHTRADDPIGGASSGSRLRPNGPRLVGEPVNNRRRLRKQERGNRESTTDGSVSSNVLSVVDMLECTRGGCGASRKRTRHGRQRECHAQTVVHS